MGTVRKSERKFVVFTSLVGVLTLTCALLLALAPAPLSNNGPANSLFAIDAPASLNVIFDTAKPTRDDHWRYVYIHHSKTAAGNVSTLGQPTGGLSDHFLIGNGEGTFDGEIQVSQRWNNQMPALPPAGAAEIDLACISICIVGDFDSTLPTAKQMRHLTRLVTLLQDRMNIPANRILLARDTQSAAGAGRYFPSTAFRESLLP